MDVERATESHSNRGGRRDPRTARHWLSVVVAVVLAVGIFALVMEPAGSSVKNTSIKSDASLTSMSDTFANGAANAAEPSGEAPMASNALPGFTRTYVNDFVGTTLPSGWGVFAGTAGGDTGSQFGASHVTVSGGLLSLNTWKDPSYANEWVTGGLCQCGTPLTYGAFFVRSRVTGPGPTIVELLWPLSGWPPEIDFSETGGTTGSTAATDIWAANGGQNQVHLNIDMTQWHTWGVVWTPTSLLYTVDGRVWGQYDVAANIPHQPLTLHLQQQIWCAYGYACPTTPQSAQIDWIAEYSPKAHNTATLGPFSPGSWAMNDSIKSQIAALAASIDSQGVTSIALTGYSDSKTKANEAAVVGERRATIVRSYLLSALANLHYAGVTITTNAGVETNPTAFSTVPTWVSRSAKVTVRLLQPPST